MNASRGSLSDVRVKNRKTKVMESFNSFRSNGIDEDEFQSVQSNGLKVYDEDFHSMEDIEQIDTSRIQQPQNFNEHIKTKQSQQVAFANLHVQQKQELELQNVILINNTKTQKPQQFVLWTHTQKVSLNDVADFQPEQDVEQNTFVVSVSHIYDEWGKNELPLNKQQSVMSQPNNRLYMVKRGQLSDGQSQRPLFKFSFNLTQLMLKQLQTTQIQSFLALNLFIDVLFRINFIAFIVIAAITNPRYLTSLLIILYLPRVFHILTITKLLFLDKYNPYNRSLLGLSHLVRSNFIDEEGIINYDIHPNRRRSVTDVLTTRCMLFIILPIEMCILPIPLRTKHQRKIGFNTYIIMTYILKGIEAIMFEPILLALMLINHYAFDPSNYPYLYQEITLILVIADIGKYIFVSSVLLIRGNKILRQNQLRQWNIMNRSITERTNNKK